MAPDPNPQISAYIPPGGTAVVETPAAPAAVSAQVSVTGVVYQDRTFEGPNTDLVFGARSKQARVARQALTELNSYPATPEETRKTVQALLMIDAPLVNTALATKLHLRTMPDIQHPPAENSFSKQQWDDLKTELEQKAAFFKTQSQGVKQ